MADRRYHQHLEPPKFDDIIDPEAMGAPRWLWRLARRSSSRGELTAGAGTLALLAGVPIAIAGGAGLGIAVGVAMGAAVVGVGVFDWRQARHRVPGTNPAFRGQPITGEGLDLLVDISRRFAFAERKIDELPDLVDWDGIAPAVEAIRWDAARHAARLSESEPRWRDVVNAPAGTPQGALRRRIAAERADELEILRGYQRTADRLMNRAADAAAAATVASELGYDLDVATPSPGAAVASATLEAVIARLDALTAAWRTLDASTDLAAEALAAEVAHRDAEAIERARALTDRLDEATGGSVARRAESD